LTREALYEAFQNRRTYASSGLGADIRFMCNDKPVGSIVNEEQVDFSLQVLTSEPIAEIEIVKGGDTILRLSVNTTSFHHRWHSARGQRLEFWSCRALLEDGEVFGTSPIWLEAISEIPT
jgi:hypothetical protein